jgi:hypothetical protein
MGIDSHLSTCVGTQSPKYIEMAQRHISLSGAHLRAGGRRLPQRARRGPRSRPPKRVRTRPSKNTASCMTPQCSRRAREGVDVPDPRTARPSPMQWTDSHTAARHPIEEMEITHFSDGLGVEVVGVEWGRVPSHGAVCGACSAEPLVVVAPMTRSGMKGRRGSRA